MVLRMRMMAGVKVGCTTPKSRLIMVNPYKQILTSYTPSTFQMVYLDVSQPPKKSKKYRFGDHV